MIQLSKMLNLPNRIQNKKDEVVFIHFHTNNYFDFKIK